MNVPIYLTDIVVSWKKFLTTYFLHYFINHSKNVLQNLFKINLTTDVHFFSELGNYIKM